MPSLSVSLIGQPWFSTGPGTFGHQSASPITPSPSGSSGGFLKNWMASYSLVLYGTQIAERKKPKVGTPNLQAAPNSTPAVKVTPKSAYQRRPRSPSAGTFRGLSGSSVS